MANGAFVPDHSCRFISRGNVPTGAQTCGTHAAFNFTCLCPCHLSHLYLQGNAVTKCNDPTAHAEVQAIRAACAKLGTFDLRGHVLVTSCYPCPMCCGASMWARVDKVCVDRRALQLDTSLLTIKSGACLVRMPSGRRKISTSRTPAFLSHFPSQVYYAATAQDAADGGFDDRVFYEEIAK